MAELTEIASFQRTLDQELLALLRGASLECPACGEFVLHEGARVRCPECGVVLHGRIEQSDQASAAPARAG